MIYLIRHGRPAMPPGDLVSQRGFAAWQMACDDAGLLDKPTRPARRAAKDAVRVFASPRRRARESAEALVTDREIETMAGAGEPYIPHADVDWPRMAPTTWAVVLRTAWLAGYARNARPMTEARDAAAKVADDLVAATADGPVLLVAHGIVNAFVGRELRKRRWTGPRMPARGYWSTMRFLKG